MRRALVLAALIALAASAAMADGARHPFAVGVNEGAASATGFAGWLLAQESGFYRLLSGAVRAARSGAGGAWLVWLSFAYGVFHAAGPGHGKAVIAAYMLADEKRLRRGLCVSAAAAALQGLVAIALVGGAFLIIGASARSLTDAARVIEIASYAGLAALGAALSFSKLRALAALWRLDAASAAFGSLRPAGASPAGFGARAFPAGHIHDDACGHLIGARFAAQEPASADAFSLRRAALAVAAAGARPCSGAILVLVFAASQEAFQVGVLAVAAMSAGVFVTTGALASSAVFAKGLATRFLSARGVGASLVGAACEAAAALIVLFFGLALLAAALSGTSFGA
ncbi:nickel/cobalt transporter [Methylocella sp.]|uniref:nickel/cobalt transporter n=1 Tax=Methylocella sp. TaxID=1978226 RepID=UPI0035B193C8